MSKILLSSDLHLGHNNIHKYREKFTRAEEHHEYVFDRLATGVGKRDHLVLLGDVAFDTHWLYRLNEIKCLQKSIILGNHDSSVPIQDIVNVFDKVYGLHSKKNFWLSHAPIHLSEMRNRLACIHGHTHSNLVMRTTREGNEKPDPRYINVCLEHTDYKPIDFAEVREKFNDTNRE
jgi:calcineurin-like phosphoesterase family protein